MAIKSVVENEEKEEDDDDIYIGDIEWKKMFNFKRNSIILQITDGSAYSWFRLAHTIHSIGIDIS